MIILRIFKMLQKLRMNRRGNVLMIFGFAVLPLTIGTGMTIDYARAARLQTKMNAITDAAALAGVTPAALKKSAGQAALDVQSMWWAQTGITQGQSGTFDNVIYNPYVGVLTNNTSTRFTGADGTITIDVNDTNTNGLSRVVTVTYNVGSVNLFGGLLSKHHVDIGGKGTARSAVSAFYQILFLVDISGSMAIGGTASDIDKLVKDPTIKCSFACHDPNGLIAADSSSYCNTNPLNSSCRSNKNFCPSNQTCTTINPSPTYSDRSSLARLYGYKLKLDYVKDALNSFMTKLKPKMDAKPANYDVGLFTFGSEFKEAQPMVNNSTTVQTAINAVDLELAKRYNPSYANQGWTYTSVGLDSARNKLTNVGDGSDATHRKTYVIFLSDGVEDDLGSIIYSRGTYYNYMAKCDALKNAGVTLFSIETAYPVVTDDGDQQYKKLVTDLPGRNNGKTIADAMKSCASAPSRYFIANDGPGIQSAADQVFYTIEAESSHLSQ